MDIHRAERLAQDRSLEPVWDRSFVIVGPGGVLQCEWLDPYFGLFTVKGQEGFLMTRSIPETCEVLMPQADDE